jgi:hypothetical protein
MMGYILAQVDIPCLKGFLFLFPAWFAFMRVFSFTYIKHFIYFTHNRPTDQIQIFCLPIALIHLRPDPGAHGEPSVVGSSFHHCL